jgi:hypothetical protein
MDLTAPQYFSDWSIVMIGRGRLLFISSPRVYAVPVTVLWVGLPKMKKQTKLRHLILLSRVTHGFKKEFFFLKYGELWTFLSPKEKPFCMC